MQLNFLVYAYIYEKAPSNMIEQSWIRSVCMPLKLALRTRLTVFGYGRMQLTTTQEYLMELEI